MNDHQEQPKHTPEQMIRAAIRTTAIRAFNHGWEAGHHRTVEGGFCTVFHTDFATYHDDLIDDMLAEGSLPEVDDAMNALANLNPEEVGEVLQAAQQVVDEWQSFLDDDGQVFPERFLDGEFVEELASALARIEGGQK